ncbi:MAG TPA: hypothetical protein VN157_01800, partial [Caulobacter sp.]|nr:hypothetical protein [Caulobacter sp.]
MTRIKLLLALVSASALTACAATAPGPDLRGKVAMDSGWGSSRSAYGQFLAGQAALQNGSNGEAATYFDEARQLDEDPGVLADRAFTAAL